jgi:hypothetical protein
MSGTVETSDLPMKLSDIGVQYDPHAFYFAQKRNGGRYLVEAQRGQKGMTAGRTLVRLGSTFDHMLVYVKKPGVLHAQKPVRRGRGGGGGVKKARRTRRPRRTRR